MQLGPQRRPVRPGQGACAALKGGPAEWLGTVSPGQTVRSSTPRSAPDQKSDLGQVTQPL